jgi:tetratricopeptide (TPR) repeat protein
MASLAFAWISLRHRRGPTPVRPVAAPNVLLISVDTLGADHLGAYGAATPTPTLDRLAEEGAVFERGMETRTMAGRLGAYLQEAGEFERSVTILEAVIRDYPDYAEAYNYLGVSYARLGRVSDSLRTLRELLELDPSSASAHSNMGSSRIERAAMY